MAGFWHDGPCWQRILSVSSGMRADTGLTSGTRADTGLTSGMRVETGLWSDAGAFTQLWSGAGALRGLYSGTDSQPGEILLRTQALMVNLGLTHCISGL